MIGGPWLAVGALAAAAAAGWQANEWRHDSALLERQEADRETERLANRNQTRITDALIDDRLRTERAAADTAERLRQLADGIAGPPPGCPGRNDDPRPAAGVLRDETRSDLVALARDADAVADRLRSCQARELGLYEPEHLSGDGRGRMDR